MPGGRWSGPPGESDTTRSGRLAAGWCSRVHRAQASPRCGESSRTRPRTGRVRHPGRGRPAPSGGARVRAGRPHRSSGRLSRAAAEPVPRHPPGSERLPAPQADQERGQQLPGLVVQFAGDPPPFLLLRRECAFQEEPVRRRASSMSATCLRFCSLRSVTTIPSAWPW